MKQKWMWKKIPVSSRDILAVEKRLEESLPEDICSFIKECNGASPTNKFFRTTYGEVLIFDSVINIIEKGNDSFFSTMDNLEGQFPRNAFPLGFDPFGNIFYVTLGSQSASIYFWRHDSSENSVWLANSLQNFLNGLYGESI